MVIYFIFSIALPILSKLSSLPKAHKSSEGEGDASRPESATRIGQKISPLDIFDSLTTSSKHFSKELIDPQERLPNFLSVLSVGLGLVGAVGLGKTVPSFRVALEDEILGWRKFQEALDTQDQDAFEVLKYSPRIFQGTRQSPGLKAFGFNAFFVENCFTRHKYSA